MRKILIGTASLALIAEGVSAAADPPEPLVVTRLADPDPNYVPPPPEPKHGRRHAGEDDQDPMLDSAMQDFGRALGQSALVQEQLIEQRCKSTEPGKASSADRFAWEAACRYTRR